MTGFPRLLLAVVAFELSAVLALPSAQQRSSDVSMFPAPVRAYAERAAKLLPAWAEAATAHPLLVMLERPEISADVLGRVDAGGIAPALDLLASRSDERGVAQYRHELAHLVGIFGLARSGVPAELYPQCRRDPTDGCVHGITQAYLWSRPELTPAQAATLCRNELTTLYDCGHAVGHGFAFIHRFDLDRALAFCLPMAHPERELCAFGVFMSSAEAALEADDRGEAQTYFDRADPLVPCRRFEDDGVLEQCYRIQALVYIGSGASVTEAVVGCTAVPDRYRNACFESFGSGIARGHLGAAAPSIETCERTGYVDDCLVGVAQEPAVPAAGMVSVCSAVTTVAHKDRCYGFLARRVRNGHDDPVVLLEVCARLEEAQRASCRRAAGRSDLEAAP